ncbi:MAG: hypothetical protein JJT89_00860 [Nitriliruptoraceae bacterium]|nr:hypothetical protein [Nitriliruptoraceae bacterium]
MPRRTAKLATPEQKLRDLAKDFRTLEREDPSPDRAQRLADLTRTAGDARQVNLAMQAATRCLEDDPAPPTMLLAAYTEADEDLESRLDALADLVDLARYIEQPELGTRAQEHLEATARAWVASGDEGERRYRLRTVQSVVSREFADTVRDELRDTPA